jgi:3-oxoacyl-[acyl-carrier protein] reductase
MTCQVDVRDRLQVKDMAERVLERFGRVDILINNAGIALYKTILETTEEEWEDIIRTNMTGVFLCCKAVLPGMLKAKHGTIVNISSIAGIRGTSHMGAYSASKFGIIGLTQSLAKEIEPSGIKVYSVCPGPTDTKLHRLIVGDEAAKMAMSPEKVAETILGVITQEIPLPSGGEIVVDGQKIYRPFNTRNWSGSFKNRLKSLIYLGRE